MNEFNLNLVTAICAGIAAIISFINIYLTKKRIVSDVFPNIRDKRIIDIREAISEFIDLYFEETKGKNELEPINKRKILQSILKIELFFGYSSNSDSSKSNYSELKDELYKYHSNIIIHNHTELIEKAQKLFHYMISRARYEAGITPRIDKKLRRMFYKENEI